MRSSLVNSLLYGFGLLIALSTITATGVFENANLTMVDRLFQLIPNQQPTPQILLVSTTEADRNDPALVTKLVAKLQEFQPRSTYVLGHSAQSTDLAKTAIPGINWVNSTSHLQEVLSVDLPPASHEYVTPVLLKAGQYRQWQVVDEIQSRSYTGFQASFGHLDDVASVIVDFSMEDGFIPLVSAHRVLEQGLTPALVQGRIVLLGDALEPGLSGGFSVPLRRDKGVSQLELQAYVLHSVQSGRMLRFTGVISTVIGIMLIGLVSTLVFQWLPSRISAIFAALLCLLVIGLQWAAVKYGAFILPAWELIIALLANFLAVQQLQRTREEKALSRIIAQTNSRLSDRVQPVNFNRSDEPWKKVLSLVNQQLNAKRSIFLEKVPADHRVKEIESLNCSINDISERRRDYEREPYSSALETNGPVQPFRDYFNEVEEGEIQYMLPLSFGGEVLGFWALSLIPGKRWNQLAFENNVRSFSSQVAELLYHRQHWAGSQEKLESPWRRLLAVEVGLNLHRQLNNTVNLLEHRLDVLEDVLNGLNTAVIVYDVFGQVLHTNRIIEHLAQENGVAVYQLTGMELLAQSNNISLDEARNKLRYVTLKHQTLVQSSTLFSNHGSYLLYIRPLLVPNDSGTDQIQPFQIRGILFEFTDLTQVQRHDEIRQDIADQYFNQLRGNLSSIGSATKNLLSVNEQSHQSQPKGGEGTSTWLSTISDKLSKSEQLTDRVEEELRNQIHMREQTVPTNIVPILSRLIEASEEAALAKELRITFEPPKHNSLNFVEPSTFEQLLVALLDLLIEDAAYGSLLRTEVIDNGRNNIHLLMESNGNGMPPEQLEQALSTYQNHLDISEDPLTRVSVLSQQVLLWDGQVSLQSNIGAGFAVDISLKTFNLSQPQKPGDSL